MTDRIGVLVVEDEEVAARAHAEYLSRLPQFEVCGVARTARQALAALAGELPAVRAGDIQLVLLDMNLPDGHGLEIIRAIRHRRVEVDIMPVTAASDLKVVQQALSLGVVQYLIKPFAFPAFRAKLQAYLAYRESMGDGGRVTQSEVDQALAALRSGHEEELPKGMSRATVDGVLDTLERMEAASAAELAEELGVSRVTARRYLEGLADLGRLERVPRYGSAGRPVLEYRLA